MGSPNTTDLPLNKAIDLMLKDDKIPPYLRLVVGHVVDQLASVETLVERNKQLEDQLRVEISEKNRLKEEVERLSKALASSKNTDESSHSNFVPSLPNNLGTKSSFSFATCNEKERLRSVVVSGITESRDPRAFNRVKHDQECISRIFDFLDLECFAVSFYRLGKPDQVYPRLLKIVLPK